MVSQISVYILDLTRLFLREITYMYTLAHAICKLRKVALATLTCVSWELQRLVLTMSEKG